MKLSGGMGIVSKKSILNNKKYKKNLIVKIFKIYYHYNPSTVICFTGFLCYSSLQVLPLLLSIIMILVMVQVDKVIILSSTVTILSE